MSRRSGMVRTLAVVVGALVAIVAGWQLLDAGLALRAVADRADAAVSGPTQDVEAEITGQRTLLGVELETVVVPVGDDDGSTTVEVLGGQDAGPGDTVVVSPVNPDLPAVAGIARVDADVDAFEVSPRAMTATGAGAVLLALGALGLFALLHMPRTVPPRGPPYVPQGPF